MPDTMPKLGDKLCYTCGGVNEHTQPLCDGAMMELISVYTRAQAIEDGVLVDCSQEPFGQLNREVGMATPG